MSITTPRGADGKDRSPGSSGDGAPRAAATAGISSTSVPAPYGGGSGTVNGSPGAIGPRLDGTAGSPERGRCRAPGGRGGRREHPGEHQGLAQGRVAIGVRTDPQGDVVGGGRARVAVVGLAVRVPAAG